VDAKPSEVQIFELADGTMPWSVWMDSLEGDPIYGIILTRIDRVEKGLFGDCGPVGGGVNELRIHEGPGYRVYYGNLANEIVILLGGGTKKTQAADITAAKEYWRQFNASER